MDVQPEHRGNLSVRQPHSCDVTRRRLIVNPPDMPNWHAGTPTTVSMTNTSVVVGPSSSRACTSTHPLPKSNILLNYLDNLTPDKPANQICCPSRRHGQGVGGDGPIVTRCRWRAGFGGCWGNSMPARLVRWDSIWGWLSQLGPLEPSEPRHPAKSWQQSCQHLAVVGILHSR